MILNLISIYLFAAVIMSIYLAAYVQSRSGSSYTRTMLFLCLAVSFYMYGYASEINAPTFDRAQFWNRFQYLGIPFVSALWLTISLMYTGYFYPLKRWLLALIYAVPVVSLLLRFTNHWHHLYFAALSYRVYDDRILLVKDIGFWMYVQMAHSMTMVFISFTLFILSFAKHKYEEQAKIHLMLVASFFSVAGLIVTIINPRNTNIDFMVIFLPVTCIMIIIAVLKYDFLEVKTMARNMVFENSGDAMLLLNHHRKIVDYNMAASEFFAELGYEIRESRLDEILLDEPDMVGYIDSDAPKSFDITVAGEQRYFEVISEPIDNDQGIPYGWLKTLRDVTEHYKLNDHLKQQAMTDELSGLLNRREFMGRGRELFESNTTDRIHLLMMDLDHFKNINDTFGHMVGDQVIMAFGRILRNSFREEDVIGRLGGEEFAVLLADITSAEAYRKAEDLRKKVSDYDQREGDQDIRVTVSIGLAKNDEAIHSLDDLLSRADQAMYMSKEGGRNMVTYYRG